MSGLSLCLISINARSRRFRAVSTLRDVDSAVSLAADCSTLLLALGACALWLGGRNPFVVWLLRRSRYRTVGRVLRAHGVGRRQVRRAIKQRVHEISDGGHPSTVAGEFRWLDESFSVDNRGRLTIDGYPSGQRSDPLTVTRQLEDLAQGYRAMSLLLKSRGFLGGGNAPVVLEQAVLAEGVGRRLAVNANFARGRTIGESGAHVSVANTRRRSRMSLVHLAMTGAPGVAISTVGVTHRYERCIAGKLSREVAAADGVRIVDLGLTHDELVRLEGDPKKGKSFDGVLPSVRRIFEERDPTSGWVRLMLDLGETSYDAVRATHYPAPRGLGLPPKELNGQAAVLTLSCVPITCDGFLVLARRSKYVINAHHLTPGVNGNLEMRVRFGVGPDNDEDHVPSPLRAIVREAREELALEMNCDDIRVLGITKFDCPEEIRITALLTACPVDLTGEQVAAQSAKADVIEGRWELGDSIWLLPLEPSLKDPDANRAYIEHVLRWTLTSDDHTPHLSSILIALFAPYVGDLIRDSLLVRGEKLTEMRVRDEFQAYLENLSSGPPSSAPEQLVERQRRFKPD